ncbi:hypothetical protein DM02DRAFT_694132 [Periconia macrospinosa]|uniref:FAD/NAD(P)-binding domain-containing protein n=1 Tax=Periconia macrospinosa TaxID=97972 RepID=A0A2V1DA73_9PLEO|nr:hypothetical protein DM02DRAFT_694132 [Periconia macrospinosa]
MKTVAIVGAGPCGIVAARKFLQSSHFTVTIFEQTEGFGGLWRPGSLVNPEMRTNQTKFTVAFSDLSWESVDFEEKPVPIYPKARQVYHYLSHYAKRYIPDEVFRFHTRVIRTEKTPDKQGGKWTVITKPARSEDGHAETEHIFDLLVVAPGAFSVPRGFSFQIEDSIGIPVLHSTSYRSLTDLFSKEDKSPDTPKTVIIVGGSHSGTEIASLLALQFSEAQYSSQGESTDQHIPKKVNIVHLTSHETFALPGLFRDGNSKACAFQPADFMLFNRANRPPETPPSFTYDLWNEQKSRAGRDMCKSILSGGNDVSERGRVEGRTPLGVLGDIYPQFVSGGVIAPVIGYLRSLKKGTASNVVSAIIERSGNETTKKNIENVVAVIDATGFDPIASLSVLSDDTKADFGFDKSCPRVPLHITSTYLCQNPALPSIAVLGFNGAHWGTFEMQARALCQRWSEDSIPEYSESQRIEARKVAEYIDSLRGAIKEHRTAEIPQNPFGDYLGLIEQASRELRLDRLNIGCTYTTGPICSARFIDPGNDGTEAFKTMADLERVQTRIKESGLFIARAAFHGLLGEWISAQKNEHGQLQTVQVGFHPRNPTDRRYGWEYLVIETWQASEHETRRVYRYNESSDEFSIWSVNSKDNLSADAELYRLDFSKENKRGKDSATASSVQVGTENEWRNEPNTEFTFIFAGASLDYFVRETVSHGDQSTPHRFTRIGRN